MKTAAFTFLTLFALLSSCTNKSDPLLEKLNEEISLRTYYKGEKEKRIANLKRQLSDYSVSDKKRMYIYEDLYKEYSTFQFDSALSVVNKQHELAVRTGENEWEHMSSLHKIMLYATAGYFTDLNAMMKALPIDKFTPQLKLEYYRTAEWANNRMADFLNDGNLSEEYLAKGSLYQDSVMQMLPADNDLYHYYKGSKMWNDADVDSIISEFELVLRNVKSDERLYAQATYSLSWLYNRKGDMEKQKEYLVLAAISDQRTQLKESMALQELALFLQQNGGDKSLSNHYLALAMEDANFYGNRLRLLQLAYKYPKIVTEYESQLVSAHKRQNITLMIIAFMMVVLCAVIAILVVTIRKMHKERHRIEIVRDELKASNIQVESVNRQLKDTNSQLREQTHLRENCTTLFMELTAAYINKFNMFNVRVSYMIKSNKITELLKLTSHSRMSEAEASEFFMKFDAVFLSTFPDFIDNINVLLKPDQRFKMPDANILSLDLRILALIRLGVKDSANIATLLNCSPQTIYNHRSQIRAKAMSKDDFEKKVMEA